MNLKRILVAMGLKLDIFPVGSEQWSEFVRKSPRKEVESLYRLWKRCSNSEEPDTTEIQRIVSDRLQKFGFLTLEQAFLTKHRTEIFYVDTHCDSQEILARLRKEKSLTYPFYVVDFDRQLRGIAITEGLVLADVLNRPVMVNEAERFYDGMVFSPLTDDNVEALVRHKSKVNRLLRAAGMDEVRGTYLVVNSQTKAWRGYCLKRKDEFIPRYSQGEYYLFAKL